MKPCRDCQTVRPGGVIRLTKDGRCAKCGNWVSPPASLKEDNKYIKVAKAMNESEGMETAVLEPRSLDRAIVGYIDIGEGCQLVYSYHALIAAFMSANKWDYVTAQEWVDYNTVRSLPYSMGQNVVKPLIVTRWTFQ